MKQFIGSVIAAAFFALAAAHGAAAQTAFAPVVVVNDDVITYYDVEQRARLLALTGAEPGPQLNRAALEGLVDDQLRAQAAERFQIAPEEGDVQRGMGEFAARYGIDPAALEPALAQAGVQPDTLMRLVRTQAVWRRLVNRRFSARATPSELELDSEIELAASGRTESFRLSELVVATGQGREAAAAATIERARAELRDGASFADVARRYSDSPSGRNGGDVGWVPETALPPGLADALRATAPGSVTPPVQTPGGISLFLVADTREEAPPWAREAEFNLRRITIDGDDDEAREAAEAISSGASGCDAIPDLSENMTMDSLDQKLVRNLPNPVRGAIQLLQAGQATRPIATEGKTEVFVVCDRTGGVDAETRNRLRDQILTRRIARLAEGFIQDLRREAVIERRGGQ